MSYFSNDIINAVWLKATAVDGANPNFWRKDFAGAWISFNEYGKSSRFGWEIDHLRPLANGGSNDFQNLVPMHWQNNRAKSDNYPAFKSAVTSTGNLNIEQEESWRVEE